MMDPQSIDSIIKLISGINPSCFHDVELRTISYKPDENGDETPHVNLSLWDTKSSKLTLSNAWIARDILLFTAFDGYLENTYNLTEGASFKDHYNNISERTIIELITKNTYRIFKLIRNGLQHNLSSTTYNSGGYSIKYCYRNTNYELQISSNGVRNLYTLVRNLIIGYIEGMGKKTIGHYEGIILTMYTNMIGEIAKMSDDVGMGLLPVQNGLKLRSVLRYQVENPKVLSEDDSCIIFRHIENNSTDDEDSKQYVYSTDYKYKDYLFPQELGTISKGVGNSLQERLTNATIKFNKNFIDDKWKLR